MSDIIARPVVMFGPPPGQDHRNVRGLIYRAAEIELAARRCNYLPIIIDHPPKGDKSTHDDNYNHLAKYGVGFVRKIKAVDGRLVGEAVVSLPDVMQATWWRSGMIKVIERGEPVEVSVGWGHVDNQSRLRSQIEGVATGILPLHLALVANGPGVCPVSEGYGLGVVYDS